MICSGETYLQIDLGVRSPDRESGVDAREYRGGGTLPRHGLQQVVGVIDGRVDEGVDGGADGEVYGGVYKEVDEGVNEGVCFEIDYFSFFLQLTGLKPL